MVGRWIGPLLSISLILTVAGCGAAPIQVADGRAAPEVASLGGAYVPAGFGEGSLWATDILTCDENSFGGSGACAFSKPQILKRLDPGSGEVEAKIPLGDFFANVPEVVFGAGSGWISSTDYGPGPVEKRQPWHAVYRIDPEANRLVGEIPVDAPTGVDFGFGSVWASSAQHGTLSRIDPVTGEVVAKVEVGRGAVDVAVDERSGAVWVAGPALSKDYDGGPSGQNLKDNKLSRVDPQTNRVKAEIPISSGTPDGGTQNVAVGAGAVWVASADGRLLKVDPATDRVVATVPLGDHSSHVVVSAGSVWVSGQNSGTWLKRVDPGAAKVVWSRGLADSGGYGRLATDGDRVWFVKGSAWSGEGSGRLTRLTP